MPRDARKRRFSDPELEVVWAGIETLDEGQQYELLRELASDYAGEEAKRPSIRDYAKRGVVALHTATEALGRVPSAPEYRALRQARPDLLLPADASVRRWFGQGWQGCLRRALLDVPVEGEFRTTPGMPRTRYSDEEMSAAVRSCYRALGHVPSRGEYLAWARDAASHTGQDRPPPRSDYPFTIRGGFRQTLAHAGLISQDEVRFGADGRASPLRHAYHESELLNALRATAEELGHSPRPAEYQRQRQRVRGTARPDDGRAALPTTQVIRSHFGSWNDALAAAGLPRVRHFTPPFSGERRPAYSIEEKLEWLRRAWAEVGEPFTGSAYMRWRKEKIQEGEREIPSLPIIVRTFGGWKEARRLAGPSAQVVGSRVRVDE